MSHFGCAFANARQTLAPAASSSPHATSRRALAVWAKLRGYSPLLTTYSPDTMDITVRQEIENLFPAEVDILIELYAFEPVSTVYELLTECVEFGEIDAAKRVYLAFWAEDELRVSRNGAGALQASWQGIRLADAWADQCGLVIRTLAKYASDESRRTLEATCEWLGLDMAAAVQLRCQNCSAPGHECECHSLYHSQFAAILCGRHAREQEWRPCGACGTWYCRDCLEDCFALEGSPECAKCPEFVCPGCQETREGVCAACRVQAPDGARPRRKRRAGPRLRRAGRRKRNAARARVRRQQLADTLGAKHAEKVKEMLKRLKFLAVVPISEIGSSCHISAIRLADGPQSLGEVCVQLLASGIPFDPARLESDSVDWWLPPCRLKCAAGRWAESYNWSPSDPNSHLGPGVFEHTARIYFEPVREAISLLTLRLPEDLAYIVLSYSPLIWG
jgi:hypothetical protein